MKWIAINLRDFHKKSEEWQGGSDSFVEVMVIKARDLEKAKQTAQIGNNDPWYLVNFVKVSSHLLRWRR